VIVKEFTTFLGEAVELPEVPLAVFAVIELPL